MRQTVFTILVISGLSLPALPAGAEVTISGFVNVGPFISSSTSGTTGTSNAITLANNQDSDRTKDGFSKQGISSNNSRINVDSNLRLTPWVSVLFRYQVDISDTGGALGNTGSPTVNTYLVRSRNSFLGLGGPWGKLKFGTNENIYEQYLYEADPLDNAAGIGGNLQIFGSPGYGVVFDVGQMNLDPQKGQAGFYRRTDQNIWYDSPNMAGVSFGASYSLNAFQKGAVEQHYKPQVISLGAQYKPAYFPFYLNVAYEIHKDMFGTAVIAGNPNGGDTSLDTGIKAQAGVTVSFLTVGGIIEQLKYTAQGAANISAYTRTAFGVHAKVILPFGYIGANAAMAQDATYEGVTMPGGIATDSGARFIGLGYYHNLSEKAQLQLTGTYLQNKASASYALPSGTTANYQTAGANHQCLYTGIKYSF